MLPIDDPSTHPKTSCSICGFTLDPVTMPGGLCPRCLLAGFQRGRNVASVVSELHSQPGSLTDDELSAELPGFELVELVGRGGGGVVWKATERALNRHVAIKLLSNQKRDVDFVERFAREAKVMARLNHPNIVAIYSFGRTLSNHCYLVMELVEGSNLGKLLATGPLETSTALSIANDVGNALLHAHRVGYIHRDIKPGNVLMDGSGRVKVADFGLARVSLEEGTTSLTARGWAVGTPHYIAPEQARGDGNEDHRADIYSLGVVLYQMLTGELPRGVFRPPSAKRALDKRLDTLVMKSLQEDPVDRYESMEALLADLKQIREECDPVLMAQAKAASHATRWRRRFEMAVAVGVSLVLGVILAEFVREWLRPSFAKARQVSPSTVGVFEMNASTVVRGAGFTVSRKFKLQPPGLSNGSFFGRSVTLSGDWLAVGAPDDESYGAGSVYIFHRDRVRGWILHQILSGSEENKGGRFGYDVAMNGPYLAVAAPRQRTSKNRLGSVLMFGKSQQNLWQQSGTPPFPAVESEVSSLDVEWLGNRLAVFDRQAHDAVATIAVRELGSHRRAWVSLSPTEMTRGSVIEQAGIDPTIGAGSESSDECAVVYQAWAAVGRPQRKNGVVEIFHRDSDGQWASPLCIEPEVKDGAEGFGVSLGISQQTLVVGAPSSGLSVDEPGTGAVFVYELAAPLP